MEQLATHNPSIVLSSKTWQRGTPAMRRLGMKVYESDPTSVAAVGRETRAIGKVLGRTRAANALATKIENDVAAATQRASSAGRACSSSSASAARRTRCSPTPGAATSWPRPAASC